MEGNVYLRIIIIPRGSLMNINLVSDTFEVESILHTHSLLFLDKINSLLRLHPQNFTNEFT